MSLPRKMKTPYLWERPNTDVFWFSRAVPKALWQQEGRKVVQFSLGSTDRAEAKALARRHASDLDQKWGLLVRARHVPSPHELEAAAVAIAHDAVVRYEDQRRLMVSSDGRAAWRRQVARSQTNLETQSQWAMNPNHPLVREKADQAIEAMGFDLKPDSPAYSELCRHVSAAWVAASRVSHERMQGDVEAETTSKLVERVQRREQDRAKPGETISELFERWAADRLAKGEKRADTINQDRKVIGQFAEFVGEDRSVRSITALEVAQYRDILRDLPPKWRSNNQLAGLPIREAAAKAAEVGAAKTAFTTVNKHLSTISPLFRWLAAQPAWAGLGNPCTGLFHDKVKGKNPRPPFSTAQLNAMLRSPLFTGFLADGREHIAGNQHADDWRKWIPLVCMFTGARIGEIAQLRIGDVRQERGVWFVHIRHDETEGLATKSGKSRPAAVHYMLERLGFLQFHARRYGAAKSDKGAALFPELEPNSRGQISGEPSRFWRKYLAAIDIKNGRDGFGSHSFRHTLADRLRSEVELLDDQIAVCLGHSQKSTTSGYGELSQGTVAMFKGWIDGVRFDGVDFSHLTVSPAIAG